MLLAAASLLTIPSVGAPILLDGRCDEPGWTAAAELRLEGDARVLILHDGAFVYFCALPAPGSAAALDIFVDQGGATAQLHVSAQVGERSIAEGGEPPWVWNNHRGWYGTPTPLVSLERGEDGRTRPRFLQESHRETAVSKSRFGSLPWRVRISVTSFGRGEPRSGQFPADATPADPGTWAVLSGGSNFISLGQLDRVPEPEDVPCRPGRSTLDC